MKIFVTGATGFLGQHFCRSAILRGHQVLALARSKKNFRGEYRVAIGSLDQLPWDEIRGFQPEVALHMAWLATPGVYLTSPQNEHLFNQSCELFDGLAKIGVGHIIGVGTCLEYAPSDRPLKEYASPTEPTSEYSRNKLATGRSLENIAGAAGIQSSWLRVFYPYGPGEHPERFPSLLMTRMSHGDAIELKTPNSTKDYIHINDVTSGLMAVVENRAGGIFNVGSGEGVRILDLAKTIAKVTNTPNNIVVGKPSSEDPFPVTVADTSRLRSLGWKAKTTLHSGLLSLWNSLSPAKKRQVK